MAGDALMDTLGSWTDFNVALGAASAALAGLIMVAISVNIRQVIKFPGISSRAAAALSVLMLSLVGSLVALVPEQSPYSDGVMTLVGCLVAWVITVHAIRLMFMQDRSSPPTCRRASRIVRLVGNTFLYVAPLLCITVGGAILLLGTTAGAYWVAIGSIGALCGAVIFAWVALVEVLR